MLRQQIHDDMITAMKAKEAVKLETIRFIWSEIKNTEIDAKHELTDNEVIPLLRREVKKRREAITLMRQGGREELATADEAKLKVIEVYLPQLMSEIQIEKIVTETIASLATKDFGAIMRAVMAAAKGQADGQMVSQIVRQHLNP